MSDLLEFLCLSFKSRVAGVLWHEGANIDGHWLCASYAHSDVAFNDRCWVQKDTVGPTAKEIRTTELIMVLNDVVKKEQDCFVVVNCK